MARNSIIVTIVFVVALTTGCGNTATTPLMTPSPAAKPTLVPEASSTPVPRLAFDILGLNFYQDPVGSLRFLLEVRNLSDFDVENVRVTVSLQDAGGQVVASRSGYARLDILRAGHTAPVMVVFFLDAPKFSTYEVQIEGQQADYLSGLLHQDLQIVDETGRVGQWVPYEVLGQVYNAGDQDAESVTLVVTCNDADGRVVAVGTGRPDERMVPAGSSSGFLVSIGAVAGEISGCKVQAEGLIVNYSDWL